MFHEKLKFFFIGMSAGLFIVGTITWLGHFTFLSSTPSPAQHYFAGTFVLVIGLMAAYCFKTAQAFKK